MAVNVLVTMQFPDALLERVQNVDPEIHLSYSPLKKGDLLPESTIATTEVLYTWTALPQLEEARDLRWVHMHTAGIEHIQGHPLLDSNVIFTTNSGIHAVQVGEYVLSMLLAWAHRLPRMWSYQREKIWPSQRWNKFLPQQIRGATIGIVGYGSVGREVARLARALGMHVLASKRDTRRIADDGYQRADTGDPAGELPDRIYPAAATCSMLSECDYVVVCAPQTTETYHLIDEKALRNIKSTALLINVSRGSLIDETALIVALREGWIAGACLDVFEVEPLSQDSPLWEMGNVLISPHVAGFGENFQKYAIDLFTQNLRRYLDGRTLLNQVDRELGY